MLTCAITILVGLSNPPTAEETQIIQAARIGCAKQYPESPCLKKLIKKEDQIYNAVCGAKEKK